MQDPTGSDTAARRAPKEIASAVRQRAVEIDDRPTTELGLRPRRQHLYRRDGCPLFVVSSNQEGACRRMRSEHNRFSLPAAWSALAGAMFVFVLGLLTLGQPALSRYYQNLSLAGNLALLPAALAGVALLLWGRARLEAADARPGGKGALWRMRALFAAVLAVQLVVARCAWYKMGWDIANVYTTAEELARGQALTDPDYFRLCPNNAPLTILQAVPMWVAVKLGLAVPFVVLPYLDAVLLNLTAYFTVRCAQRITPSRWARGFAAAVSILWIAMSPYVLYPYTDTWAVLFPVLAIYAWLTVRRPALQVGAGFAGVLCRRRGQAHGADRAHRAGTARPVPLSGPSGFFRRRVETRAGGAGRARAGRRAGAGVPARVHGIPGGQCRPSGAAERNALPHDGHERRNLRRPFPGRRGVFPVVRIPGRPPAGQPAKGLGAGMRKGPVGQCALFHH